MLVIGRLLIFFSCLPLHIFAPWIVTVVETSVMGNDESATQCTKERWSGSIDNAILRFNTIMLQDCNMQPASIVKELPEQR